MIRGEYSVRIGDGPERIIPNQFTIVGMQTIMKAAFWQIIPSLHIGLCNNNIASMLSLAAIQEPDEVDGYARQPVPMNQVNWPVISSVNGESYVESREITFPLTGGVSTPVGRLFITDGTHVISISSEFMDGVQVYEDPIITKYRLFIG